MSVPQFRQIGHLGAAPKMDFVGNGENKMARAWMTVISNKRRKDRETGEITEKTYSLSVTLFGGMAENAAKYLGKGAHVAVEGHIENNNYEKDGVMQYGHSFVVDDIEYLDSKDEAEQRRERAAAEA